ncbi:MAG: hypothetical protein ABI821_00240 [Pseudomonadota bacterium]
MKRKVETDLFLQRTLDDVEAMRCSIPRLAADDLAAWQELRFCGQRASGGAMRQELGVLRACAKELVALAEEKFGGARLNDHLLLSVTTAIEMVALEATRMTRELG